MARVEQGRLAYSKWPKMMADEPDYVSLAALRDDTPTQAGRWRPAHGLLACARMGLVGSLVMLASEK